MNLNLFHNVANVLIAGLGALLIASGCVASTAGALDCSNSWISPAIVASMITALAILKVIANILRDGVFGLWKVQPPVVK